MTCAAVLVWTEWLASVCFSKSLIRAGVAFLDGCCDSRSLGRLGVSSSTLSYITSSVEFFS
jgi:hypothetical protein